MNIIKLKDCNLIDIKTNIQFYDNGMSGSYHDTETINEITFIFDTGYRFVGNLFEVNFAKFLDFFYNKDFSKITALHFICMFMRSNPISWKGRGYSYGVREFLDCYAVKDDNYIVFSRFSMDYKDLNLSEIDKKTFDDFNGYKLEDRKRAFKYIVDNSLSVIL